MKKLFLLSLMMLLSGKSISQTDTQKKIEFSINKVEKIAVDLERFDECKEELAIEKNNNSLLLEKIEIKDSINGDLKKQNLNLIKISANTQKLKEIGEDNLATTKKQLARANKNLLIFQATTIIAIVVPIIVILK